MIVVKRLDKSFRKLVISTVVKDLVIEARIYPEESALVDGYSLPIENV
jgi:hypothetical protein